MDHGTWMSAVRCQRVRAASCSRIPHERTAPPPLGLDVAIARLADAAMSNAETYHRAQRQAETSLAALDLNGLLFGEGPSKTG